MVFELWNKEIESVQRNKKKTAIFKLNAMAWIRNEVKIASSGFFNVVGIKPLSWRWFKPIKFSKWACYVLFSLSFSLHRILGLSIRHCQIYKQHDLCLWPFKSSLSLNSNTKWIQHIQNYTVVARLRVGKFLFPVYCVSRSITSTCNRLFSQRDGNVHVDCIQMFHHLA